MKRVLITGAAGFVARHFVEHLALTSPESEVLGVDVAEPGPFWNTQRSRRQYRQIDLLDGDAVGGILREFVPSHLLHLASTSSVAVSWTHPALSFRNNTSIFLSMVEAVREAGMPVRILSVGSSEEYGDSARTHCPLTEDAPLDARSPYAAARIAQEMLSRIYVEGFGLDIVMTRSFNHVGPGQIDRFVIPSLARQLAEMAANPSTERVLHVGNVDVVRDFLDVRDVVRAYDALLRRGPTGAVFNVCRGEGRTIREMIESLAALFGVQPEVRVDPERVRPTDLAVIIGSNAALRAAIGWQPHLSLEQSLADVAAEWRERIARDSLSPDAPS